MTFCKFTELCIHHHGPVPNISIPPKISLEKISIREGSMISKVVILIHSAQEYLPMCVTETQRLECGGGKKESFLALRKTTLSLWPI